MKKNVTTRIIVILGILLGIGLAFSAFSATNKLIAPDAEVKVLGLVCPSCAIGLKNAFKKHRSVDNVAIDIKKQIMFLDFSKSKDGKTTWIPNPKIIQMVKDSGYEVHSIKLLHNKKPNRYNKP